MAYIFKFIQFLFSFTFMEICLHFTMQDDVPCGVFFIIYGVGLRLSRSRYRLTQNKGPI